MINLLERFLDKFANAILFLPIIFISLKINNIYVIATMFLLCFLSIIFLVKKKPEKMKKGLLIGFVLSFALLLFGFMNY